MTLKEIDKRLKEYDPELRLIESRYLHEFTRLLRVERHVQSQIIVTDRPVDPVTGPECTWEQWFEHQDPDDRLSAQESNCLLVFTLWPNQMDNRVFYTVMQLDMQGKLNDYRVADQVERIKARQDRSQLAVGDMVGQEAKEWYRYINTVRTVSEKHCHTAPEGGMSIMGGV